MSFYFFSKCILSEIIQDSSYFKRLYFLTLKGASPEQNPIRRKISSTVDIRFQIINFDINKILIYYKLYFAKYKIFFPLKLSKISVIFFFSTVEMATDPTTKSTRKWFVLIRRKLYRIKWVVNTFRINAVSWM